MDGNNTWKGCSTFGPINADVRKFTNMPRIQSLSMLAGAASLGALALAAAPASATVIDPQIFIQQSGSSPAGGDPNLITSAGAFNVGVAGNFTLQNPLLIIVGVYDGNGTPSITFGPGVSVAPLGTYGLTKDTASFTSSSTGTALDQLGLVPSDGSESFVNWSGGDVANGFAAPTSFTLNAFALNTSLTPRSPITMRERGAANGSYIIAYDCRAGTGSNTGCATTGDVGQTPFTNAGLVDTPPPPPPSVPEPPSLALLGPPLIGLGIPRLRP